MPWTNKRAVAFTECTWGSILAHTKEYSSFGLGFEKSLLFDQGGGPAIYLRQDLHDAQMGYSCQKNLLLKGFDPKLYAFVTPFNPDYASPSYKAKHKMKTTDFTHEREWRTPSDFTFRLDQVSFVVLPSYEVMARIPTALKDGVGRKKFILEDVYSNIEALWPTHIQ